MMWLFRRGSPSPASATEGGAAAKVRTASPAARHAPGRPRRTASSRGTLFILASLLFLSGLLRLGDGAGRAIALEVGAIAAGLAASPAVASDSTDGLGELLTALREREARLAEAEARNAERERALAEAEEEVARGLAALSDAEEAVSALLALADTAAETDISRLVAMYEAMKPAEASALFDQMDPVFAAGFLGRMRSDAAAGVLAGLPPEKAYALSVVLAGRNAAAAADASSKGPSPAIIRP